MSDESFKIKVEIIPNKSKPFLLNEKYNDLELDSKSKAITDSTSTSNTNEISEELNSQFQKESLFKLPPEYNFFLCNEKYVKEKLPEGNHYKNNSKNYKLKGTLNLNKIQIKDIEKNKINEILKDIESYQNSIDIKNITNKFNYNIFNTDIEIDLSNLSKFEKNYNINSNNLCSYINNYKFDCKFLFLIF